MRFLLADERVLLVAGLCLAACAGDQAAATVVSAETPAESARRQEAQVESVELPPADDLPEDGVQPAGPETAPALTERVRFASGSATLDRQSIATLDRLCGRLATSSDEYAIELRGHAGAAGDHSGDGRLATDRAEAVRRYLHREAGVPRERITVVAGTSSAPEENDGDCTGQACARSVEIVVTGRAAADPE